MRSKTAREQAIAIGAMHQVACAHTGGTQAARDQIRPNINIVFGITNNRGFSGCSGGGMDTNDLFLGYGKHAKRIVIAQITFGGKREFRQIR